MSWLNIKIVNGEVKEVWDTPPPEGEKGWTTAIEVHPPIVSGRQYYTGHTFDITKDPVEIVYGVEDITVEGRKEHLKNLAKNEYQQIVNAELQKDFDGKETDITVVQAASAAYKAKAAQVDACSTHDELDAL